MQHPDAMTEYVRKFEHLMMVLLMAMMAGVVVLSIVALGAVLLTDLITPPHVLLDAQELLDVFDAFLLVLIGVELLETLKDYAHEREIRAEVIILVAVIALARKIITVELKAVSSSTLLGIAALVVALGVAYALIRRTHQRTPGSER